MSYAYFPLFVDLSKKKIVVVGGGKVAERRVKTLLDFAENIQVIAPEVTEELKKLAEGRHIRWVKDVYREGMLTDAELVLAATDDEKCNEQVAGFCRKHGTLVNVSHKKELCDFYFPAVAVRANVVAGITAGGLNHAQARYVREKVEETLDNIRME